MKKVVSIICFFIILSFNSYAQASVINIVLVAPFSGSLSTFSNDLFNGLSVALPSYVNIIKIDSNGNFVNKLRDVSPAAIIGPFSKGNVDKLFKQYHTDSIIVLPFAKQPKGYSNSIFYGYDPLVAAKQLAMLICGMDISKIGVLYAFDKVDIAQKNAFDKALLVCSKEPFMEDGIPVFYNLMDDFIKDLFGVVELKKFSGITEGKIFEHSLNLDALVIFAPQNVFVHILNLMDYYDIGVKRILSANIQIRSDLIDLSNRLKHELEFITPYFMCQNTNIGKKFLSNYRKEFYADPNFMAALGYDIGYLLNNYYFKGKSILKIKNKNLLLGHLLFFNSSGKALIKYREIKYKELMRCKQEILSR